MQQSKTTKRSDTQTTPHIDYKALEEGRLFVRRKDGQLVNVSTSDTASFDAAISEYVGLFDRQWSMPQRALLLAMASRSIPLHVEDSVNQEGNHIHD